MGTNKDDRRPVFFSLLLAAIRFFDALQIIALDTLHMPVVCIKPFATSSVKARSVEPSI